MDVLLLSMGWADVHLHKQTGISLNAVLPRQEHKRRHSKQFCTDVLKHGVVKIFNGLQHIF